MADNSIITLINETLSKLDHEIISKLQTWGKTVQLTIDAIDFFIDFRNEILILKEGTATNSDFKLCSSSVVFMQIIKKELNPVEAVVSGEVAIEGSLTDALEFSEIMTSY